MPPSSPSLVHIDALSPQIRLSQLDLLHQLGVGIGCVAEGEHAPAEAEKEPGSESDESPEGDLVLWFY